MTDPQVAPLRVMLVDDHAVVREGYRRLLGTEDGLQVISEHADADSALRALQASGGAADVMVLDLSMPGRSGLDLLRRVRAHWPVLKVLVFTMHDSPAMAAQVLRAGANGFITKSSAPEDLVAAVRAVARGECVLSPEVAHVADAQTHDGVPAHLQLSTREFDVLRHLVEGLSLDLIAERLGVSAKTVANNQTLIRQKLGVSNTVELLRYVQHHRLFGG